MGGSRVSLLACELRGQLHAVLCGWPRGSCSEAFRPLYHGHRKSSRGNGVMKFNLFFSYEQLLGKREFARVLEGDLSFYKSEGYR